jgi:putative endonuclease
MKQLNYKKGKRGEDIAESFLKRKGFQIVDKNFKTRFGEIDLIATKNPSARSGHSLHFVEVKLKVGEAFGTPEEMIGRRKIMQVMRTAESYLLKNQKLAMKYPKVMVDAVCIVLDNDGVEERVDFYEDLSSEL